MIVAKEIERKFLVDKAKFYEAHGALTSTDHIRQGYLYDKDKHTVRVRKGTKSYLTYKGPSTDGGISRTEIEFRIPGFVAETLLKSCPRVLEKLRMKVPVDGMTWDVDSFLSPALYPLILAEIELDDARQNFVKPDWALEEVTGNNYYYNSQLIKVA